MSEGCNLLLDERDGEQIFWAQLISVKRWTTNPADNLPDPLSAASISTGDVCVIVPFMLFKFLKVSSKLSFRKGFFDLLSFDLCKLSEL